MASFLQIVVVAIFILDLWFIDPHGNGDPFLISPLIAIGCLSNKISFSSIILLKLHLALDAQVANEVWKDEKASYFLSGFLIDYGSSLYFKSSLIQ